MARTILIVFLSIALLFVAVEIYLLWGQKRDVATGFAEEQAALLKVQATHDALENDIQYYGNQDNLEKELRSRFNYRAPGEHMIIIVPSGTASGQ